MGLENPGLLIGTVFVLVGSVILGYALGAYRRSSKPQSQAGTEEQHSGKKWAAKQTGSERARIPTSSPTKGRDGIAQVSFPISGETRRKRKHDS